MATINIFHCRVLNAHKKTTINAIAYINVEVTFKRTESCAYRDVFLVGDLNSIFK